MFKNLSVTQTICATCTSVNTLPTELSDDCNRCHIFYSCKKTHPLLDESHYNRRFYILCFKNYYQSKNMSIR